MTRNISFLLLSLCNTALVAIVAILNIKILSTEDYGLLMLFMTYLSYMTITCFGIQDGMKLSLRSKEINQINVNSFKYNINFLFLIQLIIALLLFLIFRTFFPFLILLTFPINNMILVNKQIYSSIGKFFQYNFADLFLRIIELFSIILILTLGLNVKYLFIFYFLGRCILLTIQLTYNKFYLTNNMLDGSKEKLSAELLKDARIGLKVTIANWLFLICFSLDIFILRNDIAILGTYSQSKTISMMFMSLIVPLTAIIFISYDHNKPLKELKNQIVEIFNITMLFVILYICLYKVSNATTILEIPIIFSNVTLLLVLILPLISSITIVLKTVLQIKNVNTYVIISAISLFIFVFFYYAMTFFTSGINIILVGNIFAYVAIFIILSKAILDNKNTFSLIIFLIRYFLIVILCFILPLVAVFLALITFYNNSTILKQFIHKKGS